RAFGRSVAVRTLCRLLRLLPATRGRRPAPGRDHARTATQGRSEMNGPTDRFVLPARILHWLMATLILAVIRLGVRVTHRPPPLPADVPAMQAAAARASHYVLYGLMIAMPLIGWAMQSAGGYPVVMWKGFDLYPILPHNIIVYGQLRRLHGL